MSFYDQLKLLHDKKLYSSVTSLFSIGLTISNHCADFLSPSTKYQSYVYCGDAHFQARDFKSAEAMYQRALQLKKSAAKAKSKTQNLIHGDVTSETDVKYQLHLCYVNLKQYSQAISTLESISAKQRTPAINMALAKLYHQSGNERSAVTCYKEVLKECPLALDAALGLLSFGVKGAEVASLMLPGSSGVPNMDWLSLWIKAHAYLYGRELSSSVSAFKQLEAKPYLRDSVDILVSLGESYYFSGDFANALTVLERAHNLDPYLWKGMDIYAALLAKEKKIKELESLSSHLITINDAVPECWIAMAYYCYVSKKGTRAVYFSQKACLLNNRHIEALLLKGSILLELKRLQDATTHFTEAFKLAPYRYEAHKGLVDCYMASQKTSEALAVASTAYKQLGQTPRALTLYASVLMKNPISIEKAKSYLEKALKQDPTHLPAVYQLAEIFAQERAYDKGIELLQKQIELQSTCRLHQMLGDFYAKTNDHEKALQHFSVALHLDPTNASAKKGTERIEQHPEALEGGYDMEVEDIVESDNENELEESEVEAVWSDVEYT